MKRTKIADILKSGTIDTTVNVKGWVRTKRGSKGIAFVQLNDGSTIHDIQIVVNLESLGEETLKNTHTGACLSVIGTLISSQGAGQSIEIQASSVTVLGESLPSDIAPEGKGYPMQPKAHSMEFLRENAHFRPRTKTFSTVLRLRHGLAFAIHKFFHEKGFYYLHSPIITGSDAEGAGEMFRVTTFDPLKPALKNDEYDNYANKFYDKIIDAAKKEGVDKTILKEINQLIPKAFGDDYDFEKLVKATHFDLDFIVSKYYNNNQSQNSGYLNELDGKILALHKAINKYIYWYKEEKGQAYIHKEFESMLKKIFPISRYYDKEKYRSLSLSFYNEKTIIKNVRNAPNRIIDYDKDFFGKATNLTVSGQLEGEIAAMAMGEIYTFGPTFRAENSNTARHLAEFWMIEPEMAFYELEDNMELAQEFIQYVIKFAVENYPDDLKFLDERLAKEESQKKAEERSNMGLLEKLNFVLNNDFKRLSYTEAIQVLLNSNYYKKGKFQYNDIKWGMDLQSEHERYLVEKEFNQPVILYNYPKNIKTFYMKQNENEEVGKETVRAMDILFPGIGEMIGGSQREESYEKLLKVVTDKKMPLESLWWYLDLRKFGTAPHAGFGLGFERLIMFVTGMTNIRDVIPFPRTPNNAEF
jgi:asparaginyl-tRNA synthetase